MTTDQARLKFEQSGLSYPDLGKEEMQLLRNLIAQELSTFDNKSFEMKLNKERVMDKKYVDGKLHRYSFRCSAFYFSSREAITFNPGGFIGFAGWADSINVRPFIAAFCKWITMLTPNGIVSPSKTTEA